MDPELAARIGADLERVLPGARVVGVAPIAGGHSGFTYLVEAEREGEPLEWVLRLPPPGTRPIGPADVARQGRVMAAVGAAGGPAPAILAMAAAPVVDGRPFVLMERVGGLQPPGLLVEMSATEVAGAALEALRFLRSLPLEATGLEGEEAVGIGPELARWAALLERAELDGRDADARRLLAQLEASAPPERAPSLVHGDFHYGNLLYRDGRVAAVLDWEIAELGQPMLDVGCLGMVAVRHHPGPPPTAVEVDLDLDLDALVELSGEPPAEVRWHTALACFKYAAILGYNRSLHLRGRRPDPYYERMAPVTAWLVVEGLRLLRGRA